MKQERMYLKGMISPMSDQKENRNESLLSKKNILSIGFQLIIIAGCWLSTFTNVNAQSVTPCSTAVNLGNFGVEAELC